jgi:hypothetical protein
MLTAHVRLRLVDALDQLATERNASARTRIAHELAHDARELLESATTDEGAAAREVLAAIDAALGAP